MNQHTIATLALATAIVIPAGAQTLSTEINVERTVAPVQREASRLTSVIPEITAPQTRRSALPLTEYSTPTATTPTFVALDAAPYPAMPDITPYRGYAALGYFPVYNLGASAGYRIVNSRRTVLEASAQFDGAKYDQFRQNTVDAALSLGQRIGKHSLLRAAGSYGYSSLGTPGDNTHSLTRIDGETHWWSTAGAVNYHIGADISHTGTSGLDILQTTGASQNIYTAVAGATATLGKKRNMWVGLEAEFANMHTMRGINLDASGAPGAVKPHNDGWLRLTPRVGIHARRVTARIGANVEIKTAGHASTVDASPEALLDWNPSRSVALYCRLDGGRQFNSLRRLFDYTPFAPGTWVAGTFDVPVDGRAGINLGPWKGLALELWGGYAAAHHVGMYTDIDGIAAYLPVNLSGWRAGAALQWKLAEIVSLGADFTLLPHSRTSGYYRDLDRAKYAVGATATVRPLSRLTLDTKYQFRADRRAWALAGSVYTPLDLKDIHNLDFGASYTLTEAFTVFGCLENILGNKALLLPGIPRQGLHGLVGAELKF